MKSYSVNPELVDRLIPYLSQINVGKELIEKLRTLAKQDNCSFALAWDIAEQLHAGNISENMADNYINIAATNICTAYHQLLSTIMLAY